MSLQGDIDFLYEMGALRFIKRQWTRFLNPDFANLAEHHFRVAWIALIIAQHEKATNTDKILKMALAHDMAESRTGDVDYLSRQYVERNENLAISDMVSKTALKKEMTELLEEYEERKSLEAKIVKDADNLDIQFEIYEQLGIHTLAEVKIALRKNVIESKLYTKTAKQIFNALKSSDPHNWHVTGRNRHSTSGDWKS